MCPHSLRRRDGLLEPLDRQVRARTPPALGDAADDVIVLVSRKARVGMNQITR